MKPSKNHLNRRHHNWLSYDICDEFLSAKADLLRGDLYDLGCGEGSYKPFFLTHAKTYTGVDWAESLHDTKADVIANLNDVLPLDSGVADTIVSLSVLEHLYEPQTMLNESFRILRSKGSLLLQVPWQWRVHEAPYDFFRYTPYGLRHMLTKAGFVNIDIQPQSGFFTMWFTKLNYFTRGFVRGPAILKILITALLIPLWYITQWLAPLLDRLDRNWELDAAGYQVTAEKP